MSRAEAQDKFDWTPVIGKALAFLCLHYADMRPENIGEQAEFLARLGVPRVEAARLLGTSDEWMRVLASQRAKRSGTRSSTGKPSARTLKPAASKDGSRVRKSTSNKRSTRDG